MKRTFSLIALLLSALMLLPSCSSEDGDTTTAAPADSAAQTTVANGGEQEPAQTGLELVFKPSSGKAETVSGEDSIQYDIASGYKQGDNIKVTLPEGQHYLAVCLAKGKVKEAILYLPNSVFTYTAQNMSKSYPNVMGTTKCAFTARIPTEEEITASRNLALNPADLEGAKVVFPHAITSSVHDKTNEDNRLQFEARNAIDGCTQNNGHGVYPFQSWGPTNTMNSSDYFTVDFGRDVSLTELKIYIRADFPHDTYWDSCTVIFSDGSSQEISLEKTGDAQSIVFDAPVTTSSIKFTSFNKVAGSDWASWIEVEAIGSDIVK